MVTPGHQSQTLNNLSASQDILTILYDECRDGDKWQHQHVEDEELLSTGGGGVDLVTSYPPYHPFHALHNTTKVKCIPATYSLLYMC